MPGSLCQALDLSHPQTVALAGSGGKTTLMHALAAELTAAGQMVVITTTTKIFPPERDVAQEPWLLGRQTPPQDELRRRLAGGRPLTLAASRQADGKLTALDQAQLAALAALEGLWVLVEADGSAGKPLKAWEDYEPVLPEQAGTLVVLAGASGILQPLGPKAAHRHELFTGQAGLSAGEPITPPGLGPGSDRSQRPFAGLARRQTGGFYL